MSVPGDSPAARSFLAINSGSSSIKFGLFTLAPQPASIRRGTVDAADRSTAMSRLLDRIGEDCRTRPLSGIGHRIVHGGPRYREPQLVTDEIVQGLQAIVSFAPNHLPDAIRLIHDVRHLRPEVHQIVCFDTAFHADLPPVARRLPIPSSYDDQGIRRYGFHGLSYQYLMQQLPRVAGSRANGNVVLAHLGNGSSLAAVQAGRPVDTSMGFTPIGGVVMSTRSGDIDPGVAAHLARTAGLDPGRLEHLFSHESGLLGLSGRTADMRELLERESADNDCRLAVDVYCYEIRKRIGAYAASLGGLDALVFSGGIGEHAPVVRARICRPLGFLGIALDDDRNGANAPIISTAASPTPVYVLTTDEEAVIAQAAYALLQ